METYWIIGSMKGPRIVDDPVFMEKIKATAEKHFANIKVVGISGEPGPGCYNFGFAIEGPADEAEEFIENLTMALRPSRFCKCVHKIEGFSLQSAGD